MKLISPIKEKINEEKEVLLLVYDNYASLQSKKYPPCAISTLVSYKMPFKLKVMGLLLLIK